VYIELDDSDYSGCHRSGWAYCIYGLSHLNARIFHKKPSLYLDCYVDRTFHWANDALQTLEFIPYKKNWMGFIHHTYDETYSTYNCVELFKHETFLQSLLECKGLFVLSSELKDKVQNNLKQIGCLNVPVFSICHPMEFVDNTWTLEKFTNNNDRKILQIGAWLRNPYSIYELHIYPKYKNPLSLRKFALKGKNMGNQFMPDCLLDDLDEILKNDSSICLSINRDKYKTMCRNDDSEHGSMCRNPNGLNKFSDGLLKSIKRNIKSVYIIENLSDSDYDELLSQNIVFLDLVDCSAVNTVLECIVRNTPIFINRLPALEEVLGKDYPGFYENLSDASRKITKIKEIMKAHEYLTKLDKTKFKLSEFVKSVQYAIQSVT
jgi:hypothetical protein